jgi:polar amino acid transport system substrate-binding protein
VKPGRFRRSGRFVVGFAVLALAATGCAVDSTPVNLAAASVNPPLPAGIVQGAGALAGSSSTAPQNCGDPTASLSPLTPMPSPGAMPADSSMAAIQKRGYLIAGVDQGTYLMGYLNPKTNNLEGFDIDMVHDLAQAIFGDPSKVQFRAITSGQRIPALTNGAGAPQVDVVVRTMTISCAREQQVAFSSVYYDAQQRVLVPKNSTAQSISDLGGQKVCATTGSDSIAHIAAVSTHPIPVAAQNWPDCLVMLEQGQVAAVSTDDTILAGMAAQDPNTKVIGPGFFDEPYGIAMRKNESDFVRFVNGVLQQVRTSSWTTSYQRWLGPYIQGGNPNPPQPKYSS